MADLTAQEDATIGDAPTDTTVDGTVSAEDAAANTKKKIEDNLHARAESSKRVRKNHYPSWKSNVELRIGKIATAYTGGLRVDDQLQTEVNPDWSLTKTKTANLYSQVPTVRGTHENKQYAAAVAPFMKQLNYEIGDKRACVGVAMEEVLNDVVNAAGVGAIVVGYAARFLEVDVPAIDTSHIPPQQLQQLIATKQIPMTKAQRMVSDLFYANRISPTDLLWPVEFVGSDFDKGDWIGYTGRTSWAEGVNEWGLKEEQKQKVVAGEDAPLHENLRSEPDKPGIGEVQCVKFDRLFYWRYKVDPDEKNFKAIWEIVFVHGLDEPVVHRPWKGQQYDQQTGKYVGSCKFPVRVLTLTYITDNPIPPSDSAAGRPQVNDMRRSRSQMFQNRERSIPIRWFDVNRIDADIQNNLMRGTVQGMIPTNGDGTRSIGEIARASYPAEDFAFDQQAKADLLESWQIGPEQTGAGDSGRKTAAATNTTQRNFATRIGQERGRVAAFFLSIVEVMAGLMALYSDFPVLTPEEKQAMQSAWDSKHILHDLVLKIRPDSQIVLDVQSQIDRIMAFLNMTVKSGFINPKPLIIQLAELSGIEPDEVVIDPQPPKPEDANISYRFSGKDDLMNPFVVAILTAAGKAPTVEQIEEAKKLLLAALQPPTPAAPGAPGAAGPDGAPGAPPPAPGAPTGQPPIPRPEDAEAHQNMQLASKVAARSRDIGGGS